MKRIKRLLKSKNGQSMISVILIIAVLVIISSTLLMVAYNNIRIGKRFHLASLKYYSLEDTAYGELREIDTLLEKAEFKTMEYMKNEGYNNVSYTNSGKKDDYAVEVDTNVQKFFYDRWKIKVYDKCLSKPIDPSKSSSEKLLFNTELYNEKLNTYVDEAYPRLYFYYAQKELKKIIENKFKKKKNVDKNNIEITYENFNPEKDYQKGMTGIHWDDLKPSDGDMPIKFKLKDKGGNLLNIEASIAIPVYGSAQMKVHKSIKGNPIWANAITAWGNVTFSNSSNVYGDVFSGSRGTRSFYSGILVKNNVKNNVNIYGNIYTNGDVKVAEGSSKLEIKEYSGTDLTLKKCIYGNEYFIDKDNIALDDDSSINKFIEGTDEYKEFCGQLYNRIVPYIYKDTSGGNVYCDNILMDEGAGKGSSIIINGNAFINGSLENRGFNGGTSIEIKKDYIGITPYEEKKQGSCIINNKYSKTNPDNIIKLGGAVIVPGRKGLYDMDKKTYYSTLYGISCNDWSLSPLKGYLRMSEDLKDFPLDPKKMVIGRLKNPFFKNDLDSGKGVIKGSILSNESERDNFLDEYLAKNLIDPDFGDNGNNILKPGFATGIISTEGSELNKIEGYVDGCAILKKGDDYRGYWELTNNETHKNFYMPDCIKGYDANRKAFEEKGGKKILQKIFESRTKKFGTYNLEFLNATNNNEMFDNDGKVKSKDETGILYLNNPRNRLDVDNFESGIVYSTGDLYIIGSKDFKGAIICEGNVYIEGNPKIYYDESVISKIIEGNKIAANFFAPGQMGSGSLKVTEYNMDSSQIMERKNESRYTITKWKLEKSK